MKIRNRKLHIDRKGHKKVRFTFGAVGTILASIGGGLAAVYESATPYEHSLIPAWGDFVILAIIFLGVALGAFIKLENPE